MNKLVSGWEKSAASWFAVKSKPRKEELAVLHLQRQGFETFLPRQRLPDLRRKAKGTRLASFFPGYLFVMLDLTRDRWRSVNSTFGVSNLVQMGQFPTPAPFGLIEHMRLLADPDGVVAFRDNLKPGDRVRIVGGAFNRYEGVFEKSNDRERVTILLDMMSRGISVDVDRGLVMAATT